MGKYADEADKHAARLVDCEANCKAISKGQEKKNREKSVKDKEYQSFDKKVQDLDKLVKKIETKDMLRIDVNLEGKKQQITALEKEIKVAQVRDMNSKISDQVLMLYTGKSSRCTQENKAARKVDQGTRGDLSPGTIEAPK